MAAILLFAGIGNPKRNKSGALNPSPKNSILLSVRIASASAAALAKLATVKLVVASDLVLTAFSKATACGSTVLVDLTLASAKFNNTSEYLITGE